MTILSHTEKELIICQYPIKISNVVTFEIFEMHSQFLLSMESRTHYKLAA